ncbi:MAG: hypothetical protein IJH04_03825 [Eggerthellaceae bacterium]|nr:hypothetical protein [Eggerthellaceae bacterium]
MRATGGSKEPYCKITLSIFESALGLKPRQKAEFAWAYMSYFLTGQVPKLSRAVEPVFKRAAADADMMISGIVTGGQRRDDGKQYVIDGSANRYWWENNRRLIAMHSTSTPPAPNQYPVSSQPVSDNNPYPNEANTCGFLPKPSDAPSDAPSTPITRTISIAIADAEGCGAGGAVEPPAPIGETEGYFTAEIGHPELAQPFIAEGMRCGWDIEGIEDGWKRAAFDYYQRMR